MKEETNKKIPVRAQARVCVYTRDRDGGSTMVSPLNAELNPTCHLLPLFGAHHILRVSRIRVKVPCYKSEGRWFDPRWCHWNFSLT